MNTDFRQDSSIFDHWALHCLLVFLLLGVFFWTRLDFSPRIYFFGDGTFITQLIQLMLDSGDWEANSIRIKPDIPVDPLRLWFDQGALHSEKTQQEKFYGFAGYISVSALIVYVVNSIAGFGGGGDPLAIPVVLHAANVFYQIVILIFLFLIGKRFYSEGFAFLAVTLFIVFPLAVFESHYIRPEVWMCCLATGVYMCALSRESSPLQSYMVMGFLLGLSFSAKFNQLFLGIIPAVLLIGDFFCNFKNKSISKRTKVLKFILLSFLVCVFMALAVAINTPYIFFDFFDYMKSVFDLYNLYVDPVPPHHQEDYTYLKQWLHNANYFYTTLGLLWCVFLLAGFAVLLLGKHVNGNLVKDRIFGLALVLPCLFLWFYFSSLPIFFERTFSSMLGVLSLISALGFYQLVLLFRQVFRFSKGALLLVVLSVLLLTLWPALKLDYVFVKNYIHDEGNQKRMLFQKDLQQNFPGFWYKNVHEAYNFTNTLPEKAPKAPRIYVIKDYNGPWTARLKENMQASDFVLVGEYRSEFYGMLTNNLTVYHQQHRYWYFVRAEEKPNSIDSGFFAKNY